LAPMKGSSGWLSGDGLRMDIDGNAEWKVCGMEREVKKADARGKTARPFAHAALATQLR